MSVVDIILLVLVLGLAVYLGIALLQPERF
ncbi:MAG: K(+)-transporting ATPase subunit F [Rhodanobacteraceae bacterium]